MLTILVRMKILTDALASVASVWIRAWYATLVALLNSEDCYYAVYEPPFPINFQ